MKENNEEVCGRGIKNYMSSFSNQKFRTGPYFVFWSAVCLFAIQVSLMNANSITKSHPVFDLIGSLLGRLYNNNVL